MISPMKTPKTHPVKLLPVVLFALSALLHSCEGSNTCASCRKELTDTRKLKDFLSSQLRYLNNSDDRTVGILSDMQQRMKREIFADAHDYGHDEMRKHICVL